MRTWPSPGCGAGASVTVNSSGGPSSWQTTQRMSRQAAMRGPGSRLGAAPGGELLAQDGACVLVGGEELLDRDLVEGDVDRRAEHGDGAEQRQLAERRAQPQRQHVVDRLATGPFDAVAGVP